MKFTLGITLALAFLLLAPVAFGADEIILKGGESGIADVIETTVADEANAAGRPDLDNRDC